MEAKIIINNHLIDSESNIREAVNSPWDGHCVGTVDMASKDQAEIAVKSAVTAFGNWKKFDLSKRIKILQDISKSLKANSQLIGETLSNEIGKHPEDALSEVQRAVEYLDATIEAVKFNKGEIFYGDVYEKYPRNIKTGLYSRVPLGVVLAISPFNYPINLSITKIAPALITGNTVVFKPPKQGSISSFMFYKIFIDAGLPEGVLNFVPGVSSEIGDFLVSHKDIALVAFTGSTKVGDHIKSISNGKPLLLELGGKDPAIVTEKADLDIAVNEILKGAFSYCGQRCTAQKIVFIHESVYESFKNKILTKISELNLNPMINSEAVDFIQGLIEDAKSKNAEILVEGIRNGNFISASVVSKVTPEMRIFHEEQFGPLMPIVIYKEESEAVNWVNSLMFGLQASVYSESIEQAFRIADKLETGTVQINAKPDRGPDNFPFGGVKDSGQYMQGITETMELMTRGKLTVINLHKNT